MSYFTPDFLDFLKELAADNSKEWFDANRKRYEKSVKNPFKAFVDELISRIHEVEPNVTIEAKDAIMRINRDIRFSKDKTPYKTHVSAIISSGGKKDKTVPGIYVELSPADIRICGGAHELEKDQLQSIREKLMAKPGVFEKLIEEPDFKKRFGAVHGDQQKRLPAEFKEAVEKQPLLANKQFYYYTKLDAEMALADDLVDQVMGCFHAAKPVKDFLAKALGH